MRAITHPLLILLSITLAGISLTACATGTSAQNNFTDIQISGQGLSVDNDPMIQSTCKDFQLTESQVRSFFSQSKTITEQDLNLGYDLLPCYSEGTLRHQSQEFYWLIRAGGTGELTQNGTKIIRACPENECDDIKELN